MIIEHLNKVLSKDFNDNVLFELKSIAAWRISPDEYADNQGDLSVNASDSGMLINSYNKDIGIPKNRTNDLEYSFLNVSAHHIFRSVLNKSQFNFYNIDLKRYLWNYYNRSSDGVYHTDSQLDNAYSIVYYLHDSDGGTIIGNDTYSSISNDAIIFKSNIPHKGVGPKLSKNRFLLNIMFTADSYERK